MTAFIFTTVAVTLLVIASFAIEQLAQTYEAEMLKRQAYFDRLEEYGPA